MAKTTLILLLVVVCLQLGPALGLYAPCAGYRQQCHPVSYKIGMQCCPGLICQPYSQKIGGGYGICVLNRYSDAIPY